MAHLPVTRTECSTHAFPFLYRSRPNAIFLPSFANNSGFTAGLVNNDYVYIPIEEISSGRLQVRTDQRKQVRNAHEKVVIRSSKAFSDQQWLVDLYACFFLFLLFFLLLCRWTLLVVVGIESSLLRGNQSCSNTRHMLR